MNVDTIADALETAISVEVAAMTYTRGFEFAEGLNSEDFPHLALYDASEAVEPLRLGQRQQTWSLLGLLSTYQQTNVATRAVVDQIRDAIETDPTLGGLVDSCWVEMASSAVDDTHGEAGLTFTAVSVY